MAQESCNLSKDEELLKPPSPAPPSLASLITNHRHDSSSQKRKRAEKAMEEETEVESITRRNRCSSCNRKVGLTGFRCRCGDLFCGQHRYSDSHDCTFDYKSFGRDLIYKANPLVRPAKIIKI